ncbi:MAG: hypothetical protein KGI06_01290 [Candidatus Micrarchaeota archaeon]|nr:hypothetical protein [Candidatus Micrarchaeota archaeon]
MATIHMQKEEEKRHRFPCLRGSAAGTMVLSAALACSPAVAQSQAGMVRRGNMASAPRAARQVQDGSANAHNGAVMPSLKDLRFNFLEKPYNYTMSNSILKPETESRWPKLDQGLMLSTIILDAIDWNQTLHRADHLYKFKKNSGYTYYEGGSYFGETVPKYEGGLPLIGSPILGSSPSPKRVNLYFMGLAAADIIIPKLLRNHDKLRKIYFGIRIAAESDCTIRNINGDAQWDKWYSSSETWLDETCKAHPDLSFCRTR